MAKNLFITLITLPLFAFSNVIMVSSGVNVAQMYQDANLVIAGDVISICTNKVSERDTLESDGWIHVYRTLVDTYFVRVDSVLKGSYSDTLITIESKNYPDHPHRKRFAEINEKGDSLFVAECSPRECEIVGMITKLGKGIILLKKEDDRYISILYCGFNELILDFFKRLKNKKAVSDSD